ncbi:hypothetical protein GCM10028773_42240 [Spirosoma koreense]
MAMNELFGKKYLQEIAYLFSTDDLAYNKDTLLRVLKLCKVAGAALRKNGGIKIFQFVEDIWLKKIVLSPDYFITGQRFDLLLIDSINLIKSYLPRYFSMEDYNRLQQARNVEFQEIYYYPRFLKLLDSILQHTENGKVLYLASTTLLDYSYIPSVSGKRQEMISQRFGDKWTSSNEKNGIPEEIWKSSYLPFMQMIDVNVAINHEKDQKVEIVDGINTFRNKVLNMIGNDNAKEAFSLLVEAGYRYANNINNDFNSLVISKSKNLSKRNDNVHIPTTLRAYKNPMIEYSELHSLFYDSLKVLSFDDE